MIFQGGPDPLPPPPLDPPMRQALVIFSCVLWFRNKCQASIENDLASCINNRTSQSTWDGLLYIFLLYLSKGGGRVTGFNYEIKLYFFANSLDPNEMPRCVWVFTVCQSTCMYEECTIDQQQGKKQPSYLLPRIKSRAG